MKKLFLYYYHGGAIGVLFTEKVAVGCISINY